MRNDNADTVPARSLQASLDCEVAVGYVIFDAICLCIGAVGLRATVSRPVMEGLGEAARPALPKIERLIAEMGSPNATAYELAGGWIQILLALKNAECLGAVVAAFKNSLTWWNAILYGASSMATIAAMFATDGAAFAAEVVLVLVSAGFLISDIAHAIAVCGLTPSRPTYPIPRSGGKRVFDAQVAIIMKQQYVVSVRYNIAPGVAFRTNWTTPDPWERFTLVPIDADKGTFALQTAKGFFVSAQDGGGRAGPANSALTANATSIGGGPEMTQRLTMHHHDDGTYSIIATSETKTGYYVTANEGGGIPDVDGKQPFRTDATHIGPWETFTFEKLG